MTSIMVDIETPRSKPQKKNNTILVRIRVDCMKTGIGSSTREWGGSGVKLFTYGTLGFKSAFRRPID